MTFSLSPTLPYRLAAKHGADFWPTPREVVVALLDSLPPPPGRVLEPCAGDGAIVRVLLERGYEVHAAELRSEELAGLVRLCPTTIADWLRLSRDRGALMQAAGGEVQAIVTNPPFSLGVAFADACMATGAAYVALLLPAPALAGQSAAWGDFWRRHPPTAARPVAKRPRFGGAGTDRFGVCWWVWERDKQPMDMVPV